MESTGQRRHNDKNGTVDTVKREELMWEYRRMERLCHKTVHSYKNVKRFADAPVLSGTTFPSLI